MAKDSPCILAFAGSLRRGSYNKMAVKSAVVLAEEAGAEVTHIDLADYPMPVYDGDVEAKDGVPESARKLKALMKSHDGFLISTPEYNSSIPGTFKNVIDWVSRSEEGEKVLECFKGKTAALMSASPGALGGMRSLAVLRATLENIGTMCLPEQVAFSAAHEAFDEQGRIKDKKREAAVKSLCARLVEVLRRLR